MSNDAIKKNNERVLKLMRDGQSLSMIPVEATHFPPRPFIKKDPKAIAKLFGSKDETRNAD
jgi:hypothetical protein